MELPPYGPEPYASANSATPACWNIVAHRTRRAKCFLQRGTAADKISAAARGEGDKLSNAASYFLEASASFLLRRVCTRHITTKRPTTTAMPKTGCFMTVRKAMTSMQSWPTPSAPYAAKS